MFAWDLFREFRDRLKIAKFNTSKQNLIFCYSFFFFFKAKKRINLHVPQLLSILAIVNVSADRVLSDKYGKPCFSFFDYALHNK